MSKRRPHMDLTGIRFNKVLVVGRGVDAIDKNGRHYETWECVCDCGRHFTSRYFNIIKPIKSCGCEKYDKFRKMIRKHGDSNSRLNRIWCAMKTRCLNPNSKAYPNYGGRGISICDSWMDYKNFKKWATENGYEDGLSIERIDVNKNYCPENCTFIPLSDQVKNRRCTVYVDVNGEEMMEADAIRLTGISYAVIKRRRDSGVPKERWLDPPRRYRKDAIIFSYDGKELSLREWARLSGVRADRLYNRYYAGDPVEKILKEYIEQNLQGVENGRKES